MAPMMTGANPDIELDCMDFTYISSSGLRLLLTLQKSVLARGGKLVIKNMKPEIKEVFDMTGFSKIFTII
jgi:serine/threonine-protein kinase RsbW